MMSVMPYTPIEMMIIAAAREIRDGETVFMGTYWPIPSVMLAKKTHAPHITIMVEGGLGIEAGRGRQTNSPPTEKELRVLRSEVDPQGMYLREERTK